MRSQRRLRLYVVVVVVFLLAFTYFTTDTGGGVQSHRFYKTTVTAMNNAHAATPKKNNEAKDRSHIQRLDLENNNNNNNGGARKTPSSSSGSNEKQQEKPMGSSHSKIDNSDEISVAGRTKMSVPKPKEDQVELSNKKPEGVDNPKAETETHAATEHEHETSKEDKEEQEASDELDSILKRSPIIVFSKSYCPYSRKAKSILGQYHIVPTPHIVELDKHPLGPNLQKLLGKVTGRRTVPNVLINGVSIGGGDDVGALDRDDTLISKIKSVGGKSIMEIERLPAAEEGQEHEI